MSATDLIGRVFYHKDATPAYRFTLAQSELINSIEANHTCTIDHARKNIHTGRWLEIKEAASNTQNGDTSAVGMLEEAAYCIGNRAAERDTDAERSMAATVRAFNGMYGTELTEEQGWQFMVLLKMARSRGGKFRRDDYVDGAAYFALAGECNK